MKAKNIMRAMAAAKNNSAMKLLVKEKERFSQITYLGAGAWFTITVLPLKIRGGFLIMEKRLFIKERKKEVSYFLRIFSTVLVSAKVTKAVPIFLQVTV